MNQEKKDKRPEVAVTPQSEDFSKWYTEVIQKAKLADYGPVRGTMVIREYGYSLWENIRMVLDQMFQETGHQNVYFPLFIPMSFIQKEREHIEGFSPELAVVTHAGGRQLEEPLVVRPTSETIICSMFAKWVSSYRDLPILINQWANMVRWEMRPRLFLRNTEFLWQEGHTIHATEKEAQEEVIKMLEVYMDFATNYAGLAPLSGEKTASQRFAGAVATYAVEGMMRDKKALQCATSHFLGQKFSIPFGITFLDQHNKRRYVWQTSWGLSTRIIGAIIMTHGDDKGLILPPKLAPVQVIIIPIWQDRDQTKILKYASEINSQLKKEKIKSQIDERGDLTPGFKFNDWEMRGVPLRIEIGTKELKSNTITLARRDSLKRFSLSKDKMIKEVINTLDDIQKQLFKRAKEFREAHTKEIDSYKEFKDFFEHQGGGFALSHLCKKQECEQKIKDELKVTTRVVPLAQKKEKGSCLICQEDSFQRVVFAYEY